MMRIDHIALNVSNLEKAKEFFVRWFGGRCGNLYHNPKSGLRSYFISFDDDTRVELMHWPDMGIQGTDTRHTGYAHMAFSVGGKDAVDALTRSLAEESHLVISGPRITGDGYYESCIQIFDGIVIELMAEK